MIYFVMPHYIMTDELTNLAIQAMQSLKQTANIKIVSVDDGSPLDTAFLEEYSDAVVTLKENQGFAKACNAGFRYVLQQKDAAFIGCANNDIEVYNGWLEAMLEPFGKFTDVGITGLVSTKDKELAKSRHGRKITNGGLLDEYMQAGGLWLMSKQSFMAVYDDEKKVLFDEQFEVGGEEDVDLFLRIRHAGYSLIMSDKASFWHKEGATRWNEDIPGFKIKNKAIEEVNYDRFAKKWGYDIRQRGLRFTEEVLEW